MKKSLVLLIAAAAMVACNSKSKSDQTKTEEKAVLTKCTDVTAETVHITETYTSEIEPFKENDITPAASGLHIDRILVDVGARVAAGQVVATLEKTTLRQQESQLNIVEDVYKRMKPVYEAGGISAQELVQYENQYNMQKEVVENLRRNSEVRSPISGVVTARNFEPGDLFGGQPILHIMQIDKLKVMANISEQYFADVKVGMPVQVSVDIYPGETFEGRVSLIYPALDTATRTFKVEVTLPNTQNKLRPGMYARATFDMGTKEGIMVPDISILKQSGSNERYVYVIEGDKATRRSVRTGRQVEDRIDILSGVSVGEKVATTALTKLSDGAKIELAGSADNR